MSTQTDSIATRHNNTSTITTPLTKGYWTPERLTWLEEAVIENQYLYVGHIEEGNHLHTYRPSTGELIRQLKGLPEWAGLSSRQAHDALVIGLGKIRDAGGDPWDLLPDNDVKGLSAEEDFLEAWPEVRGSRIDLTEVVAHCSVTFVCGCKPWWEATTTFCCHNISGNRDRAAARGLPPSFRR